MNKHANVVLLVLAATILFVFGPALFTDRHFAYRDAAHYYFPLFNYIAGVWANGEIPLWNPQEELGRPLLADATSSVLYPGKLLFALPFAFGLKYKLYIVAHIAICALTAYGLARRWKVSQLGSGFCCLAYSFHGAVFFQYSNITFLVGAAWLPLALYYAERSVLGQKRLASVKLAVVLALMTLGGDPQSAYHIVLIAGAMTVVVIARGWRVDGVGWKGHACTLSGLCVAIGLYLALAAVQILPSAQWTQHSDRLQSDQPRTIYEWGASSWSEKVDDLDSFWGPPQVGTHHQRIYSFSVGPWRWLEVIWPNFGGQLFPTHRRWMNAIPAEQHVWTPSLYGGLLPFVFAVSVFGLRSKQRRILISSWLAVFGFAGSLGSYGLGWLATELVSWSTTSQQTVSWGPQIGGLYWLMVTFLPGFVYFRYPAKLFVFVALGTAVLAGIGTDRIRSRSSRRQRLILWTCTAASGFLCVLVLSFGRQWLTAIDGQHTDSLFGPFDAHSSWIVVVSAAVHAALVSICGLFSLAKKRRWAISSVQTSLLVITAADIVSAHRGMVPTVPSTTLTSSSVVAKQIFSHRQQFGAALGTPRIFRSWVTWHPGSWARQKNVSRFDTIVDWDVASLCPKHHLLHRVSLVESYTSYSSANLRWLLYQARQKNGLSSAKGSMEPNAKLLAAMGVEYLILPDGDKLPCESGAVKVDTANSSKRFPEDVGIWRIPQPRRRVWQPKSYTFDHSDVDRKTNLTRFLSENAEVESRAELTPAVAFHTNGVDTRLRVNRFRETVNTVRFNIDLSDPGLVILNDYYYPGWQAHSLANGTYKNLPIYRVNGLLKGVFLEAGDQEIVFVFRPKTFIVGAAISGVSWVVLLVLLIRKDNDGNLNVLTSWIRITTKCATPKRYRQDL